MAPHHLGVVRQYPGPLPLAFHVEAGRDPVAEDGPDQATVGDRRRGRVAVVLSLGDRQRVASGSGHPVGFLLQRFLAGLDLFDFRQQGVLVLGLVELVLELLSLFSQQGLFVGDRLELFDFLEDCDPVTRRGDVGVTAGPLPQHLAVGEIELGQPERFDTCEDRSPREHRQAVAPRGQRSGPGNVLLGSPVSWRVGAGMTAGAVGSPAVASQLPGPGNPFSFVSRPGPGCPGWGFLLHLPEQVLEHATHLLDPVRVGRCLVTGFSHVLGQVVQFQSGNFLGLDGLLVLGADVAERLDLWVAEMGQQFPVAVAERDLGPAAGNVELPVQRLVPLDGLAIKQ